MTKDRIIEKLKNYKRVLARLEEAFAEKEPDQFVYDAAVKRFEFTYELAWKLLRAVNSRGYFWFSGPGGL